MTRSHVMRLGPLDRKDGVFFEYIVFPGRGENQTYFAPDDRTGIEAVLDDYAPGELVCEDALAGAAAKFGIAAAPLDRIAAHGLALYVYDRVPGRPFQAITEQGLIYQFAHVVAQFRAAGIADDILDRPMRLQIEGTIEFVTDLYFHTDAGSPAMMTMMMEKAVVTGDAKIPPVTRLEDYDRLWVDCLDGPAFALEALKRAHGLDVVPVPWCRQKGDVGPVVDMHLALLVAIFTAAADLTVAEDTALANFRIKEYEVRATVLYR